jgi:hypothetical protein
MNVSPVIDQLRAALRERTRLEDDFKLKILNRINAILEGLNECDRGSLPPAAAGVLNIAIGDLNDIVREIRNPVNMTDANVEEIVEPLERRRRNNTVRLLPAGRPVDGQRPLAPASSPSGSRSPFSIGSPSSWFSRPSAPAETSPETRRSSSVIRNGPRRLIDGDDLDDDERYADSFDGVPPGSVGLAGRPGTGGKRTRRKYRNRT